MTADDLQRIAMECGIDEVSVVAAGKTPVDHAAFREAVAAAPEDLGYLARSLEKRLDPNLVLPGIRSIVVGLLTYGGGSARPAPLPPRTGWISRYAMGQDYHVVAGQRFAALADEISRSSGALSKWYVDTGPVAEKAWAVAAGLGFQGKNTLLVSPRLGSFVFIGVVLTNLEIESFPAPPNLQGCGGCNACVEACPAEALDGNGRLDRGRCIAHLTVSSKKPVPEGIRLAGNLFGCDICQDVCPFNRRLRFRGRPSSFFAPMPGLFCPDLDNIMNMDEMTFSQMFRGSPVFRRGLGPVQEVARRLLSDSTND